MVFLTMQGLVIGSWLLLFDAISVSNSAPHRSSRGRDTVLTGTTRVFAVSRLVII